MAPRVPRFQNDNMLSSPSPDFHSQDIGRESLRVIPYQFTEVSHVTLSELDETWWVGSPSELM